jgi:hypothetical protein
MSRANNEAEAGRPTVEQEMSAFKGFSTKDGDTITPETPEDLNPVAGKNMSAAEIEAAKTNDATAKTVAKTAEAAKEPVLLTDTEKDNVLVALDKALGREATPAEEAKALSDAQNTKNGSGKTKAEQKSSDRYRAMQRRERDAIRRADAAEKDRTDLAARIAALEKAPLTDKDGSGKDDAGEAPDPKKFEFGELDANYIRALARFETRQEMKAAEKNKQTETLTAAQKVAKEKFEAVKAEFEDKGSDLHDDFAEVVMDGARDKAWPLSDQLGAGLLESEFGPQIAYELASDPKEAKRVFGLSEARQLAWLGRKEAELEASAGSGAKDDKEDKDGKAEADPKPAPKVAQVSRAPAPIQRARGQGSASAVPGDTSDFAAFEAAAMGRSRK